MWLRPRENPRKIGLARVEGKVPMIKARRGGPGGKREMYSIRIRVDAFELRQEETINAGGGLISWPRLYLTMIFINCYLHLVHPHKITFYQSNTRIQFLDFMPKPNHITGALRLHITKSIAQTKPYPSRKIHIVITLNVRVPDLTPLNLIGYKRGTELSLVQ